MPSKILLSLVCIFLTFSAKAVSDDMSIEKQFIQAGLIDIHSIDPTIQVDLVNSNASNNIFRENFYNGLTRAYLQEEVAHQLSLAQSILKNIHPDYSILIMDAARPRSVSRKMFEKMQGTRFEHYVAHPDSGSMHNYGVAVDVTLVDNLGNRIDMGFIPFYQNRFSVYFGYAYYKKFGLSDTQKNNRQLLQDIMLQAGFIPLSHEWWHFDGIHKDIARERFNIIE
ncbi:D-alanyl-D-alanine dipeptidase [Nitrincola lacisaponensis]|uniref:D-alanyl-D-alanine dipeptidase n=1 Tax=Nitrincola lacisaponensis TaxID=267850 RepID=A0A063Y986_9GAMM|nr:M15 family metallopeptidase [Nitrincola lacisaponensis]KDE40907.1 D-alanyl-D-alanine dipeptidase [Nitrincola lacisaponensis]